MGEIGFATLLEGSGGRTTMTKFAKLSLTVSQAFLQTRSGKLKEGVGVSFASRLVPPFSHLPYDFWLHVGERSGLLLYNSDSTLN
jgi:hypothetical protein